jgi:hypothetical protein
MTQTKKIAEYFQSTKARRQFFSGENLIAYDVDQLLIFERDFTNSRLSHTTSVSVLLACWRRARDSWSRVTEALPPGPLRDQMALELQDRDEAMNRLAERASEMLKEAENV